MASCNYHPISPAAFRCEQCNMDLCSLCCDESLDSHQPNCLRCNAILDRVLDEGSAPPFWRRLQEIFRYPLASNSLTLIIGVSVLQCFLMYIPLFGFLTLLPILLLSAALLKYCIVSLTHTANGDMNAPDINEAYSGGIELFIKFVGIHFCIGLILLGISRFSPLAAMLLAALFIVGYPAIMIRFAQSEEVLDSIHPLHILQLMTAIGLPYGLLLTFLGIMMASMGVLNELLGGAEGGVLSIALQTVVTNYYSVAMYHLLGYVLFQYQHRLGYPAQIDNDDSHARSKADILQAKIEVMLKDGNYDEVVNLFYDGFKQFPDDKRFYDNYFQFIYNCKNSRLMDEFAEKFLSFLLRMGYFDRLNSGYKMIKQVSPGYEPNAPELRHAIAQACQSRGDPVTAVKLINGMHKKYPNYPKLVEAFQCMAKALDDMPSKAKQAEQCKQFVKKLSEAAKPAPNAIRPAKQIKHAKTESNSTPKQSTQDLPPIKFTLE